MRDIAYQLDGVVDDLFGIVDTLQLGGLVEVDQVLIQVKPGGGEQGTGVVVQVGGNALALFFLQTDRSIEQELLLVLFHALEAHLIPDHLPLVEDDKYNEPDGKREHTYGAEIEHQGHIAAGINCF